MTLAVGEERCLWALPTIKHVGGTPCPKDESPVFPEAQAGHRKGRKDLVGSHFWPLSEHPPVSELRGT